MRKITLKSIVIIITSVIIFIGGIFAYQCYINPKGQTKEKNCINSGGKVFLADCYCAEVKDFPNTCKIGVCSCNPKSGINYQVKMCDCGNEKCFMV